MTRKKNSGPFRPNLGGNLGGRKRKPRKRKLWIVGYGCGCSAGPSPRKELLEYCGKHGDDAREWYPAPPGTEE